jgi:hypothetical protein
VISERIDCSTSMRSILKILKISPSCSYDNYIYIFRGASSSATRARARACIARNAAAAAPRAAQQQQSKTMRAALFAPLLAGCLLHGASAAGPLKVFVFAGQCVAARP